MNEGKPRLLFFLPLPPPIHGAALRNKSLVESKLLRAYFEIEVIPFDFASEVDSVGKFSLLKLAKMTQRTFTIIGKLLNFRPNLVYFNISLYGFALYRDSFFVAIFKLFRTPLLYHLRTQGVKRQVEKSRIKSALFTYVFKNVNVICLSPLLANDIKDVYDGKPYIVSNGITDLNPTGHRNKISNKKPVILFLSNLTAEKGVLDLVESFRILKERGVEFEGWIAGPSGNISINDLQKILSQSKVNEVSVLGGIYGEDKLKLLSTADIFVLPTHFEAFPGVILEAMQFFLPVVASHEGAIPEIVDDGRTGLLVEKKNALDLAKKLERLILDKEVREAMGETARQKYLTNYAIESFEENMINVFFRSLKGNDFFVR